MISRIIKGKVSFISFFFDHLHLQTLYDILFPFASSMDCFVFSSRPDLYSIRRWRRIQYLSDQFWRRWQREYCLLQQKHKKWYDVSPNSHVGDIVLISDKSCPRNQCRPLARVTEVYPSKDGLVRKVLLLVSQSGKKKLPERPIHKLILIFRPNEDESDA